MKNRHWLWIALSALTVVGLIACGKSESKNSGIATVPLGVASCPAGSALINSNGSSVCQGPGGVVSTPIYNNNLAGGTSYSSDNYCYNSLKISNSAQLQKFLKEAMGVCDQNYRSGGAAGCSVFSAGSFRVNLSAGNGLTGFQIFSRPQPSNYYYSLPKFSDFFTGLIGFPIYNDNAYGVHDPLSLSMSTFQINNSQGFEVRQYGERDTLANRSLIQVQVAQGKPGDPYFTYTLAYEGITFMTGTFVKNDNYSYYCGY